MSDPGPHNTTSGEPLTVPGFERAGARGLTDWLEPIPKGGPYLYGKHGVEYRVVRKGAGKEKQFFVERVAPANGGFIPGLNGTSRVPFRLSRILAATAGSTVFIVEGEEDVRTLEDWELLATTNCGGSGGSAQWKEFADSGDFETLNVVVLRDNDEAGQRHAEAVLAYMFSKCASLKFVELPGITKKGEDVSDWRDGGHTRDELLQLVDAAPEYTPTANEAPRAASKPDRETRPTDDELRDRWLEQNPDTVFARSEFLRYHDGLWAATPEKIIKREIEQILVDAKPENVRPTKTLLASVCELAKAKTAERDEIFDAQGDFLVLKNGTLHIPARTLGP